MITPIKPGSLDALTQVLARIEQENQRESPEFCLARIKTIHIARWVILPEAADANGKVIPAELVYCDNFDGLVKDHLEDLVTTAEREIDEIYSHCEEYPPPGQRNKASRIAYLKAMRQEFGAFYQGVHQHSVSRILQEAKLRERLREHLDELCRGSDDLGSPERVREMLRSYLKSDAGRDCAWALQPPEKLTLSQWVEVYWKLGIAALAVILLVIALVQHPAIVLGILGVLSVAFYVTLRLHEESDARKEGDVRKYENRYPYLTDDLRNVQNQFSNITEVKAGLFRRLTVTVVLFGVEFLCRYYHTRGEIGGLTTLVFARWRLIDGGRRVMFLTSYAGSWEAYLGDTSDAAASFQLSAIWSNTMNFPRTVNLGQGGNADGEAFKSWTRAHMAPTQVWYSAYKDLSPRNIFNNSGIREGLCGHLSGKEVELWVRRL